MELQVVVVSLFLNVFLVDGARILGIFPVSLTGEGMGSSLMNELALRNHEVTVLNLFPIEQYYGYYHVKNYSEIALQGAWPVFLDLAGANDIGKKPECMISRITGDHRESLEITRTLLLDDIVQTIIDQKGSVDLIVMEYHLNDAAIVLGELLDVPIVLFSSSPASFHANYLFANPSPSSYVPNLLTGYAGKMSFWQRLRNSVYDSFQTLYRQFVMVPRHEELLKEFTGRSYNLHNVTKNVDLILLNSHPAVNEPTALMPGMVEIGGFHIKEKPLPQELRKFMDEANEGVIYFSVRFHREQFGTLQAMVKSLGQLEQKVLWHYEDENLYPMPSNFKLLKSFEFSKESVEVIQQGVLAHPNTVAFFTQGDMSDLIEAVYNAVPIIAVPLTPEQTSWSNTVTEKGYGVSIVPDGALSEDDVTLAVSEVLNNIEYLKNIKMVSDIMSESPIKPMNLAMKWIELAVRHKGLKHLQSPGVRLAWYQRNKLDIILTLFAIDVVIFLIFYYVIKHIIHGFKKRRARINKKRASIKYLKLVEDSK